MQYPTKISLLFPLQVNLAPHGRDRREERRYPHARLDIFVIDTFPVIFVSLRIKESAARLLRKDSITSEIGATIYGQPDYPPGPSPPPRVVFELKRVGIFTRNTFSLLSERFAVEHGAHRAVDTAQKRRSPPLYSKRARFSRIMYTSALCTSAMPAACGISGSSTRRIAAQSNQRRMFLERREREHLRAVRGIDAAIAFKGVDVLTVVLRAHGNSHKEAEPSHAPHARRTRFRAAPFPARIGQTGNIPLARRPRVELRQEFRRFDLIKRIPAVFADRNAYPHAVFSRRGRSEERIHRKRKGIARVCADPKINTVYQIPR